MKILVNLVSRQTIIQVSVVKEANPDFILFITTEKGAEEQWYQQIPVITAIKNKPSIPYRNVFLEPDLTLSKLIETVKKHIHELILTLKVTEIVMNASSGKGIHRISLSDYLKRLCDKRGLDYSIVYFDTDRRKMVSINVFNKFFKEKVSSFSIEWNIEDRLSIYGATVRDYSLVCDESYCSFADQLEKFSDLYSTFCSSVTLRTFFTSYENIRSLVSRKNEFEKFAFSDFIDFEIEKLLRKIFGLIPSKDDMFMEVIDNIATIISDFFCKSFGEENILDESYDPEYKIKLFKTLSEFSSVLTENIKTEIFVLTDDADARETISAFIPSALKSLCRDVAEKIKLFYDIQHVNFSEQLFNDYRAKFVDKTEFNERIFQGRAELAQVFEKMVSFAVYQNVRLDGSGGTLIELDTMVLFRNGYIHIFEAKTGAIYNKDINSRIMILKKFLGDNVTMDIVIPFIRDDIELLLEKDEDLVQELYSFGLKNLNSWMNFLRTTDKSVIALDDIEGRLFEVAMLYK